MAKMLIIYQSRQNGKSRVLRDLKEEMRKIFRGQKRLSRAQQVRLASLVVFVSGCLTCVLYLGAILALGPFVWASQLAFGLGYEELYELLLQLWQVFVAMMAFFLAVSTAAFLWIRHLLEMLP